MSMTQLQEKKVEMIRKVFRNHQKRKKSNQPKGEPQEPVSVHSGDASAPSADDNLIYVGGNALYHEQSTHLKSVMELMDVLYPVPHSVLKEDSTTPFVIYRTDTNQILGRAVGYEASKKRANDLRKSHKLKWDQVRFKADRSIRRTPNPSSRGSQGGYRGRYRTDVARTINPSKGTRFKQRVYDNGYTADLD